MSYWKAHSLADQFIRLNLCFIAPNYHSSLRIPKVDFSARCNLVLVIKDNHQSLSSHRIFRILQPLNLGLYISGFGAVFQVDFSWYLSILFLFKSQIFQTIVDWVKVKVFGLWSAILLLMIVIPDSNTAIIVIVLFLLLS